MISPYFTDTWAQTARGRCQGCGRSQMYKHTNEPGVLPCPKHTAGRGDRKLTGSSWARQSWLHAKQPLMAVISQPLSVQGSREVCSQEYTSLLRQTSQQNLFPLLKLLTRSQLQPQPLTLPENNDFISSFLPPFVLLETDAAVILLWGKASGDRGSQVTQGPVEIVV